VLQFRDAYGVPPEKVFDDASFVVAVFEPDNPGWRASRFDKRKEIRIRRYNRQIMGASVIPNRLV
jgi:hypothetical protein